MHSHRVRSFASFVLALALTPALRAQQSGAVYSTNAQGGVSNLFNNKNAVYIAGGPGPNSGCSGNGLANGIYYFQVTNPSGTQLLSTDALANRRVNVAGGVIASVPAGGHAIRNGPCGSKIVQLIPFSDSPSSGGEYKVWLTPAGQYVAGQGTFGFLSSGSKTDNFKVRSGGGQVTSQSVIGGTVYYDFNRDGVYQLGAPGEIPLSGWKVEINSDGVVTQTFTDVDGHYEFLRDQNGSPHVLASIAPPPGFIPVVGGRWLATTPALVNVVANLPSIPVDFGNLFFENRTDFARSKGYWQNQGEAELEACDPDWRIALNELCLRNNHTSPPDTVEETFFIVPMNVSFDEAFAQLGEFLVGDSASGVLIYILATQFTAAILNVSCGPLHDLPTFIDQENDNVLVDLNDMIEHTHGMMCDPRSANTGPGGDEEWRAHIMMCLDEWNGMNTTGTNTYTRTSTPPPVQY
jgi:hypothetical protein